MKLWQIPLPQQDNEGNVLTINRAIFLKRVATLAGGYTLQENALGFWRDPETGGEYPERVDLLSVACSDAMAQQLSGRISQALPRSKSRHGGGYRHGRDLRKGNGMMPSHDRGWPHTTERVGAILSTIGGHTRNGFNYGRALGSPDHKEYNAFVRYTRSLAVISKRFSDAQWRLEMACRDVRLAETEKEQGAALEALRVTFHMVDRDLEAVECLPLRFYRWGRMGNVLKKFNPFG